VLATTGVEVAVVRSVTGQNKRDKAALRNVKIGDFVASVNGMGAVACIYVNLALWLRLTTGARGNACGDTGKGVFGLGFAGVCNQITTAPRPVVVGFQRLEKAVKADFRKGGWVPLFAMCKGSDNHRAPAWRQRRKAYCCVTLVACQRLWRNSTQTAKNFVPKCNKLSRRRCG